MLSVYRTRQWSDEWESKIQDGCGCLLFVRVDSKELKAPLDWMNCPTHFGSQLPSAAVETDDDGKEKPPTQVVLVDWLQFLRKAFTNRVGGTYRPRIGLLSLPGILWRMIRSNWVRERGSKRTSHCCPSSSRLTGLTLIFSILEYLSAPAIWTLIRSLNLHISTAIRERQVRLCIRFQEQLRYRMM